MTKPITYIKRWFKAQRQTKGEPKNTEHTGQTEQTEQTEHKDFTIESMSRDFDTVASEATFAMASFLKEGQVLLEHYAIEDYLIERDVGGQKMKAGTDPVIDGLVAGKWNEEDVLVFVGVRFSLSTVEECQSSISEVISCMGYWEFLVKEGQEYMDDTKTSPYMKKNFRNMKVAEHGKRKLMIALAAERFADSFAESPWNLQKLQDWFRIRPNSSSKFVVTHEA